MFKEKPAHGRFGVGVLEGGALLLRPVCHALQLLVRSVLTLLVGPILGGGIFTCVRFVIRFTACWENQALMCFRVFRLSKFVDIYAELFFLGHCKEFLN